jgi:hypothetical protein
MSFAPSSLVFKNSLNDKPHWAPGPYGWIYGVTDFNGEVKAAGVIEACASCHAHAAHDRLFGPIK